MNFNPFCLLVYVSMSALWVWIMLILNWCSFNIKLLNLSQCYSDKPHALICKKEIIKYTSSLPANMTHTVYWRKWHLNAYEKTQLLRSVIFIGFLWLVYSMVQCLYYCVISIAVQCLYYCEEEVGQGGISIADVRRIGFYTLFILWCSVSTIARRKSAKAESQLLMWGAITIIPR
jgi:hypothetical protein